MEPSATRHPQTSAPTAALNSRAQQLSQRVLVGTGEGVHVVWTFWRRSGSRQGPGQDEQELDNMTGAGAILARSFIPVPASSPPSSRGTSLSPAEQTVAEMLALALQKQETVSSSTALTSPRKKAHLLLATGRTGVCFHLPAPSPAAARSRQTPAALLGHAGAATPSTKQKAGSRGKAGETLPDSPC